MTQQAIRQPLEPLVNAREVGEVLVVGREKVLKMARNRVIPSIKIGHRTVRFRLADVLRALGRASAASSAPRAPMVPPASNIRA